MARKLLIFVVALLALAACADRERVDEATLGRTGNEGSSDTQQAPPEKTETTSGPARVDPRKGGVDVGLGEWAVTPEAEAIRPGKVTFSIHNRGTVAHGFEIELEGDSSGSGSGDLFEAESELLQPGEKTTLTISLSPGVYEYECLVDGHDDLGMEGLLDVRDDAPKIKVDSGGGRGAVAIAEFAFSPTTVQVQAGEKVTWENVDPAAHTVTALDDEFDSGTLEEGDSFSQTFQDPGTYAYRCNIHPTMEGKVKVE